jgi:tetratricopeptide (TPR) repeat protein
MRGSTSEETVRQLQLQLEALRSADPFRVLEVAPSVDGEGVRRAFLAATKKYHPNRFALEPATTREVVNELFLLIRRAYDILSDEDKRKAWRERLGGGGASATPVRATSAPAATPPPAATPRPVTVRPASVPAGPPPTRTATPVAGGPITPARPATSVPAGPGGPSGPARPATAAGAPPRAATVPGSPATQPPARAATPSPAGLSGRSGTDVQAMLDSARTRGQRFDEACAMLAQNRFREAREAFHKLALEDPQAKRFRVHMLYATGRELMEAQRFADAQRELERAVQLDPEHAEARAALDVAIEKQKKPGILGKLFGK